MTDRKFWMNVRVDNANGHDIPRAEHPTRMHSTKKAAEDEAARLIAERVAYQIVTLEAVSRSVASVKWVALPTKVVCR